MNVDTHNGDAVQVQLLSFRPAKMLLLMCGGHSKLTCQDDSGLACPDDTTRDLACLDDMTRVLACLDDTYDPGLTCLDDTTRVWHVMMSG